MSKLSNLFAKKNKTFSVQMFGKLPLYKDFISMLSEKESMIWRELLLKKFKNNLNFSQKYTPFIFKPAQKKLIVGIIENSSDGIREFPFSLFVLLSNDYLFIPVWDALKRIRVELETINDIDELYHVLQGKTLQLESEKNELCQNLPDLSIKDLFICTDTDNWKWEILTF